MAPIIDIWLSVCVCVCLCKCASQQSFCGYGNMPLYWQQFVVCMRKTFIVNVQRGGNNYGHTPAIGCNCVRVHIFNSVCVCVSMCWCWHKFLLVIMKISQHIFVIYTNAHCVDYFTFALIVIAVGAALPQPHSQRQPQSQSQSHAVR